MMKGILKERERVKSRVIEREREWKGRETGQNITNKIEYIPLYYKITTN